MSIIGQNILTPILSRRQIVQYKVYTTFRKRSTVFKTIVDGLVHLAEVMAGLRKPLSRSRFTRR